MTDNLDTLETIADINDPYGNIGTRDKRGRKSGKYPGKIFEMKVRLKLRAALAASKKSYPYLSKREE